MDVCLLPQLLEHVVDWRSCIREAARVLRPGGVLYLSTTNVLCPVQEEFNLPLYSWYPAPLKRYCERIAVSTRPAIANYAKYPAVHWFSFYGLRRFLEPLSFRCMDRFDLIDAEGKRPVARLVLWSVLHLAPFRLIGHMATSSTYLVAVKSRMRDRRWLENGIDSRED
jgi:2-polyprenyl-6-hydroxyphenyl methylase/3-demethylubiquinone-9 3-methyltransferase